MGKAAKGIIIFLMALILSIATIIVLAFSKGNYSVDEDVSLTVINKIREGEKSGKEVEITVEELNQGISVLFKNPINRGNITVKTPEVFLEDKYIGFKAPVIYKGQELLLYTKGELNYKEENLEYIPKSFMVGKLPVPRSLVFTILNKYRNENISITKNAILANKKLIPFSISSLKVQDSSLYISFNKVIEGSLFNNGKNGKIEVEKLKEQLENIKRKTENIEVRKKIENAIKNIESSNKNTNEIVDKIKEDIKSLDREVDKTLEELRKKEEEKEKSIKSVRGQLAGAIGSTGSSKGDEILSIMISTMDNLLTNPSYSYLGDVERVKNIYSKLSSKEKDGVKKAIISNVNLSLVNDLRATFGI